MKNKNPLQIKINPEMEALLVETVIQDFEKAKQARNKKEYGSDRRGNIIGFDGHIKNLLDCFYGRRETKSKPWTNCSNKSMKIMMGIVEMFHARAFGAIWNEDLLRWKPVEPTDKETAERIEKLMNWWIKVKMNARDFFDGWSKYAIGLGDVFVEGSWKVSFRDKGEVKSTPVTDEFGQAVYDANGPVTVEDKVLNMEETTRLEIIPKENVYFQENQRSLEDEPVIIKLSYFYSDLEQMESEGKVINVKEKPVLGKSLREAVEGEVSSTYANFTENESILKEVSIRNTRITVLKEYLKIDIDGDGFAEDIRILVDPDRKIYLGGVAVKDISKKGCRPIEFCKFNSLIESPESLEGMGLIEMAKPLSDEIDAIFNQMSDAHTLGVLRPGFYDPSGSLQPQTIEIAPNKLIPVSDPQRNIYFPDFQIPTERLLMAMRTVMEFIERLTGASSYVMGKESEIVGGSGTATRTQAIMMSAEQRFAAPTERLRNGACRLVNLVLDLVQKNIPPGMEGRVLGENGEPIFTEQLNSGKIDSEMDAYLLDDPSMGSANTERQLATMVYSTLLQNPLVGSDPRRLYTLTADLLKAYKLDYERLLGPEPEEKDTDSPEDENTLMVELKFNKVQPNLQENHMYHIMKHSELLQSPTLAMLNPVQAQEIVQFDQQHIMQHQQMMGAMMQMAAAQSAQKGVNSGSPNSTGATSSVQGTGSVQNVENLPGPIGEMARAKGTGESGYPEAVQK